MLEIPAQTSKCDKCFFGYIAGRMLYDIEGELKDLLRVRD